MAQTLKQYLENPPPATVKLCGCGKCGKPLEMNDPLGPQWMKVDGKKVLVNEDCYYDDFPDNVGGLGVHGPKNSGPID